MPGSGIGRLAGFSTSGPPGSVISIAVMVAGKLVIGRILSRISWSLRGGGLRQ
jgi:hypothetical protein